MKIYFNVVMKKITRKIKPCPTLFPAEYSYFTLQRHIMEVKWVYETIQVINYSTLLLLLFSSIKQKYVK